MEQLLDVTPLHWAGIGTAMLVGAIIGLERQVLGKPVGIRTSILICLGTYVFVALSNSAMTVNTDPSRIIGQVITGIGFLGAGVILTRNGIVMGVTSAACIWILASIGCTIALEHYLTSIKLAVLTVAILVGVENAESTFKALQKGVHRKGENE
ncbi:MAG: MgtC/SapB family protein [Bacteroidota bacterium]|nr:MgtC/SapB family protein [Bacteroidota bacterium]MDP4204748.1 MgtC/SapB family protein [Bacteroidota bacterium]